MGLESTVIGYVRMDAIHWLAKGIGLLSVLLRIILFCRVESIYNQIDDKDHSDSTLLMLPYYK